MGLSARIFGFNSWSMLVPQALEGVAAVGLLYAMVKRWAGPLAGLGAGAILAFTPATALMFRFNNPDALLVLLMVAGAYAMTRAIEGARLRWVLLGGTALGFAFLTKDLQGWLPLPAFALAYLVAAPTSLRKRLGHVLAGGLAVVVSAGWWVAAVELWPKSSRPYIGGSTNNSVLDLVFGYNGFGRLTGSEGGPGGGGGNAGSSFGGATGITRLLSSEMGNEISWLLPASLVALVAGLWVTRRAPRTDRTRAALLLWGGWLLITGVVFSYMKGVVHPYYTVALAPAIGALVAIGARALWVSRAQYSSRLWLAAIVAAAGGWSSVLLSRNQSWHPEIRYTTLVVTAVAVAMLALPIAWRQRAVITLVAGSMLAGLAGTTAYAAATAAQPHTGSIPSVGPASAGASGGPGGGTGGAPTGQRSGTLPNRTASGGTGTAATGGGSTSSSSLAALLKNSTQRWAAATIGSQTAAELELSTGASVMAIGGFSGSDPSPTLAQFQADVKAGLIHYFIAGGGMGGGGGAGGAGSGVASQITAWVTAHFKATTVGGTTVYDLTSASS
jgi:4-amino-4-deoxy-L-arabinose transferase-like glycosyltransferase